MLVVGSDDPRRIHPRRAQHVGRPSVPHARLEGLVAVHCRLPVARRHTVDIVTSAENAKCGRYYSTLPSSHICGVDALEHSWSGESDWANTPFNLVGPENLQDCTRAGDGHPRGARVADAAAVATRGRCMQQPRGASPEPGGLHQRLSAHSLGAQVAARGLLARARRRDRVARVDRWNILADGLRAQRFGVGEAAATAQRLVRAMCQIATKRDYVNAWERFAAFRDRTCARA